MSAEYCTAGDFGRPLEVKRKVQAVRRRRFRMANDAALQGTVGTAREGTKNRQGRVVITFDPSNSVVQSHLVKRVSPSWPAGD